MNNKRKIIIILCAAFVIIGIFLVVALSKESKDILKGAGEEKETSFSEEGFILQEKLKVEAEKKGFSKSFQYEGNWYANVGGKWVEADNRSEARAINFADRQGYTQYFQYEGQWYGNVNGKWVPASSESEARAINFADRQGYTQYFQYEDRWYANVDGKWIEAENREEARIISGSN